MYKHKMNRYIQTLQTCSNSNFLESCWKTNSSLKSSTFIYRMYYIHVNNSCTVLSLNHEMSTIREFQM